MSTCLLLPALATLFLPSTSRALPSPPAVPPSLLPLVAGPASALPQEAADPLVSPIPGPHHARIKDFAGVWDVDIDVILGLAEPPRRSKAVETVEALANGLWSFSDLRGDLAGRPFHGHGIAGFDAAKGRHVAVWIDVFGDSLLASEGTCDGSCRVLTLHADRRDPMGRPVRVRQVHEWTGPDARLLRQWVTGSDGVELLVYKAAYRRRK